MPTPVLAAKLFIPPPRPNAVLRAGLVARLNAGLYRKLTLISAPAGFGKTRLASAWIDGTLARLLLARSRRGPAGGTLREAIGPSTPCARTPKISTPSSG